MINLKSNNKKMAIIFLFFSIFCFFISDIKPKAEETYTTIYTANFEFYDYLSLLEQYTSQSDTFKTTYPYVAIISACKSTTNPNVTCPTSGHALRMMISKEPITIGKSAYGYNYNLKTPNGSSDLNSSWQYYQNTDGGIDTFYYSGSSPYFLFYDGDNVNTAMWNVVYSNHNINLDTDVRDITDMYLIPYSFPKTGSSRYITAGGVFHKEDISYTKHFVFNTSQINNYKISFSIPNLPNEENPETGISQYSLMYRIYSSDLSLSLQQPRLYNIKSSGEKWLFEDFRQNVSNHYESGYLIGRLEDFIPVTTNFEFYQDLSYLPDNINVTVDILTDDLTYITTGINDTLPTNWEYDDEWVDPNVPDPNAPDHWYEYLYPSYWLPLLFNGIGDVLSFSLVDFWKEAFLPNDNSIQHFTDIKNAFLLKFPVIDEIGQVFNSILGYNVENGQPPVFKVSFPMLGIKEQQLIDFSHFSSQRELAHSFIKYIAWASLLIWLFFKKIPKMAGGSN